MGYSRLFPGGQEGEDGTEGNLVDESEIDLGEFFVEDHLEAVDPGPGGDVPVKEEIGSLEKVRKLADENSQ